MARDLSRSLKGIEPLCSRVPEIVCPDCDRTIAMHELETRTVATRDAFETSYRCPYCAADFEDVSGML